MDSFFYQQQQQQQNFTLDPVFFPNSPIEIPDHLSNASSSCFTCYHSPPGSSTSSLNENKRKQSDVGSSLSATTFQSMRRESKKEEEEELKDKLQATNVGPPPGYIHVRARRGQATDSHSLAERVRRKKICERMKKLQGLVPGCENVVGKALVLDEIINYIQCLQNQVEFLSMKLAPVNPMLHGLSVDCEVYRNQAEKQIGNISQTLQSSIIQNNNYIINPPSTTTLLFEGAATNRQQQQIIDPAASSFPLHGLGPTAFSQGITQSFLMQEGDHRRGFLNQVNEVNNMCSF